MCDQPLLCSDQPLKKRKIRHTCYPVHARRWAPADDAAMIVVLSTYLPNYTSCAQATISYAIYPGPSIFFCVARANDQQRRESYLERWNSEFPADFVEKHLARLVSYFRIFLWFGKIRFFPHWKTSLFVLKPLSSIPSFLINRQHFF